MDWNLKVIDREAESNLTILRALAAPHPPRSGRLSLTETCAVEFAPFHLPWRMA
jgi:hypothetical protein